MWSPTSSPSKTSWSRTPRRHCFADYPEDWTWWSGVVALVGGKFKTTKSDLPAIRAKGHLFARDVTSEGVQTGARRRGQGEVGRRQRHRRILLARAGVGIQGRQPREGAAAAHQERTGGGVGDRPDQVGVRGRLTGRSRATTRTTPPPCKRRWTRPPAAGKTVVYFRSIGGGDPNWFTLKGDVTVTGRSVRLGDRPRVRPGDRRASSSSTDASAPAVAVPAHLRVRRGRVRRYVAPLRDERGGRSRAPSAPSIGEGGGRHLHAPNTPSARCI